MAITVHVPTPLRTYTKGMGEVAVEGKTVGEVIDALERAHPGLKEKMCDATGKVRRFINIYANNEDVRFLQGVATELKDGDQISIVPAIAGG